MKKLILLVTIIFLAVISCQKKYDIEADRQALINITSEEWDKNELAGNPELNVKFFIEDAVFIVGGKIFSGKESIRSLLESRTGIIPLKVDDKVEDIWISGDLAAVKGKSIVSYIQREDGDTINFNAAFLSVCKRQTDGTWKLVHCISTELED
jgi:uncharacterized protein (TIGR02246 family)